MHHSASSFIVLKSLSPRACPLALVTIVYYLRWQKRAAGGICRNVIWLQLNKASDFHAFTGVNMIVFVISVVWCSDNSIMLKQCSSFFILNPDLV